MSTRTIRHVAILSLCLASVLLAQSEDVETNNAQNIVYEADLVYGRIHGAGLLADVAYPKSETPLPAIISVHGGRWRGGHKRDGSAIAVKQWASFGFFAMSIDDRLES